ncbi:DUF2637 domain-containing protein [Streptomyces sp. NY05-11A]|uniref:DUF2637 domain-containing protein n=1 Tax=Streptomyces soliscabiei TaxID=588897 RepID=UPI0029B0AC6F|nr:DUF2637 domain-containing protein [Streptomyces sp. NY05-11A]MDX2676732.1 DUF2637 domain-containing protein [Streptomyces sp. NY05-11A]
MAGVAAYASYVHQREFALQGGADGVSTALWPLSVDGLLLLSTAGLLRPRARRRRVVWLAVLLGIAVSLAANVAEAPRLDWQSVLVAGWPPLALLLSIELLVLGAAREAGQSDVEPAEPSAEDELSEQAARLDEQHWTLHQRPISAESVRKELHIGAQRTREVVASVRAHGNGQPHRAG